MAKFTDYTEKTEPVDTDLALIYDTPAKVNKKFTFGNLWKWIAKKIVSEGISQLETTNKTIPGAINELNSKKAICTTGWTNGNAKSIFEIFSPTSPIGIYSYYNIKDIPFYSSPANAYVTIIKGHELIIVFNEQSIFITGSSRNIWTKKWHSINLGIIS